ncbi:DUF2950 domain-containing protein [Variovorax sp. J22R133]|uniref:DUF2950 domain-containing protein n=1 Tax=Variovorax brevis TaxID=3053503 RepID=UPI0025785063|nr:DUF2950 domain-containing protein [Variovorax sp. J22R133]MDM0110692.1 DUF2950 domain-containing protein [Variovorax sp. J22R133]
MHTRFKLISSMAVMAASALLATPALAQRAYPSAEAASQALYNAVLANDTAAMRTVLGADFRRFIPVGSVDRTDVDAFLSAWSKQHKIVAQGDSKAMLAVGDGNWTLPVPIVKRSAGWQFDPREGADLMRTRRIGRNELAAMQAVLAYFDAQKEYAMRDRDGDGVLNYAQKFVSTPGQHDGLYWASGDAQGQSPLGPLYAGQKPGEGYHGFNFKILKAQGKNAPGGAYDYVIGGRMRAGFALIAWPIRYGDTGVTSFMVNHQGVLYQKDLGPETDKTARAMTLFDPDASWTKVNVP